MKLKVGDYVDVSPPCHKYSNLVVVEHSGVFPVIPDVRVLDVIQVRNCNPRIVIEGHMRMAFENGTVIDVQLAFTSDWIVGHRRTTTPPPSTGSGQASGRDELDDLNPKPIDHVRSLPQYRKFNENDKMVMQCIIRHAYTASTATSVGHVPTKIKRGQALLSQLQIARETGLGHSQVRSAIKRLVCGGEILSKSVGCRYTLFTVIEEV